ncbi:MAG: lamin tail domain-containing protein [Bacteriodetes bacterium]|nr:lamin tail domain-containing protein [Bacteroidota bacterium]
MKSLAFFLLVFINSIAYSQIVINEIQPYPVGNEPEWVELFNPQDTAVTLKNIYLRDKTSRAAITEITLQPKGLAILVKDSGALLERRIIPQEVPVYKISLPSLNNTTESVYLTTKDSLIIDSIYYDVKWSAQGISIERVDPMLPALSNANLKRCEHPDSATCGFTNSVAPTDVDAKLSRLEIDSSTSTLRIFVQNSGKSSIASLTTSVQYQQTTLHQFSHQTLVSGDSVLFTLSIDSLYSTTKKYGYTPLVLFVSAANDVRHTNDTIATTVFISPPVGALLVNEFMFDPQSGGSEFIEFYNTTTDTLNLQGMDIHDASTTALSITSQLHAPPKGYCVIATDSSFLTQFPLLRIQSNVAVQKSSFSLNSDGDAITLRTPYNKEIDYLYYSSKWHLTDIPTTKGKSLEKLSPMLPSNSQSSWTTCALTEGATPAVINSVARELPTTTTLTATPNPFSPRSTVGAKQSTICSYSLPFKQAHITATVFDVNGMQVKTLLNNHFTGATGTFVWDGRNDVNFALASGAYIVLMEAVDESTQQTHSEKLLLVIGE